eukprot:jgi/Chlat1/4201/Chrsp27S00314
MGPVRTPPWAGRTPPQSLSPVLKLPTIHLQVIVPRPKAKTTPALAPQPWLELHPPDLHLPTFAKQLIAGGIAGGAAKTLVAPLERVKILLQTGGASYQTASIMQSLRRIQADDGVRGFFRGNGASVARIIPYAAFHFMAYEQYLRILLRAGSPSTPIVDMAAGSLAGSTAVLLTYPLDLVRTRLAVQLPDNMVLYKNIRHAFRYIVQQEGPTLYGIFPYAGLKFYTYEALKARWRRHHYPNVDASAELQSPPVHLKLAFGAAAGLVGQTVTFPLDAQGAFLAAADIHKRPYDGPVYRGTWHGLRTIVVTSGWRSLFAGLSINYLKVTPSVAIGFTVYDYMKAQMGLPLRPLATG